LLNDSITIAVEALSWMELEGLSERQAFNRSYRQLKLRNEKALRFGFSLMTETIRRLNVIDYIANWAVSPKTLDDYKLGVRNFLRIYIHWVHFRKADFKEALGFIKTGRRILGRDELFPIEEAFGKVLGFDLRVISKESENLRISLETFHQEWFVEYCFKLFRRDEAIQLLKSYNELPSTCVKINSLKCETEDGIEELEKEGVILEKIHNIENLLRVIKTRKPLVTLKSYRDGIFQIQDVTSQVACLEVEAKPGELIFDICAAPGIKTTSLIQFMQDKGKIISIDRSDSRMKLWKKEIRRVGGTIAEPVIADAHEDLPLVTDADKILLDPPCSGTGIYARSPSMKWHIRPSNIDNLARLQFEMLKAASKHVKEKGIIVYATCSILKEENELVLEKFLNTTPNFKLTPIKTSLGTPGFGELIETKRFYPHKDQSAGFFLARIQRID
jgi:16S rRNA (cytosine967-C5)-methyltransferase